MDGSVVPTFKQSNAKYLNKIHVNQFVIYSGNESTQALYRSSEPDPGATVQCTVNAVQLTCERNKKKYASQNENM